jgi:FkbM family methyltransferase
MVLADVGANAGFYSLEMAAMVGPAGRVFAFEPDAFNFHLLQTRMKKARATNVEAYQIALGVEAGKAMLYCSAYNRADNRLNQSHREAHVEASEVEVRRLDEFMSTRDTPALEGIKIDVQGGEEQVLRGAQSLLGARLHWMWIEFSPDHLRGAGTNPEQFLALLGELKMDVFEIDRAGRLRPFSGVERYLTQVGSGYGDLVLLRRAAADVGHANSSPDTSASSRPRTVMPLSTSGPRPSATRSAP